MAGRRRDPSRLRRGGRVLSQPELSIGGKILDASAVAAWTRGSIAFSAWLGAARVRGLTYYLPSLAITEVRVLRPDVDVLLDELAAHPHVVLGRLDAADAAAVEQLLDASGTVDVLAGWVVHACRQRGWPALSTDPGRLHRVDPAVEVDPI